MNRTLITVGAFLLLASANAGGGWTETGDAGGLLPGQMTMGVGSLTFISGELGSEDGEDLFCIEITDEASFTAVVDGVTAFDTQLFLFNPAGMGVTFNDDSIGLLSALSSAFVTSNGTYYLAISQFDNDAESAGGEIWLDTPFGVERAPDGPGAGSPLSLWDLAGMGSSGRTYTINLTGAEFCAVPEPGTFLALGVGLTLLAAVRRRK